MTLKPDERFVSESLLKYFGPEKVEYKEGEDPPDIYLLLNGEKIAVEITRLPPVSFDESGYMQNRNTQDLFGVNIFAVKWDGGSIETYLEYYKSKVVMDPPSRFSRSFI